MEEESNSKDKEILRLKGEKKLVTRSKVPNKEEETTSKAKEIVRWKEGKNLGRELIEKI